jgi:hypothetical protein
MKRYLIFIFTLFYFSAASGATVEFHFCMGKLVEWGMAKPSESKTCSNCKMKMKDSKDCCKKNQQQVKIEKAQKAEFSFDFKSSPIALAVPQIFEPGLSAIHQSNTGVHFSNAPPRTEKTPVFLRLRTFRI